MAEHSILLVHAAPNARQTTAVGWIETPAGRALKLRIAAPPEEGKANAEIQRFMAKTLGISASCINLTGGKTSRYKRLSIALAPHTLEEKLKNVVF